VIVAIVRFGSYVYEIAVDGRFLYWVEPSSTAAATDIRRLPLDGGPSIVLASVGDRILDGWPSPIKLNDERVFALVSLSSGFLLSVGVDGTAPLAVAAGDRPRGLTFDKSAVYWGNNRSQLPGPTLMGAPLDGGPAAPIAFEPSWIEDVTTDGVSLYWVQQAGDKVMRAQVDGGLHSVVATGQTPRRLVVDGAYLYWTNVFIGTVMRAPLDGGPAVVLAANQGDPSGIAIDSTHLYWANLGDGRIMSLALDGGGVRELLVVDGGVGGGPFGLALDAKNIYFTQPRPGLISRIAK
jgi:hypothetical protein